MQIIPLKKPINQTVQIPGSKSLTNRAFLIAALAKGKSLIKNPLLSDDTKYMMTALQKLGVKITPKDPDFEITGTNGKFKKPAGKTLYLGNAGTAVRFLTAAATLADFPLKITGNKRMQARPIQDLIDGLNQLGAKVASKNGCPPVTIAQKIQGGTCQIPGDKSSQYFSALLITTPYTKKDVTIKVKEDLVSKPYLDQTIAIMKSFGVKVQNKNYREFKVKSGQTYQSRTYQIEPDASSATYFGAIAALTNSQITIKNLNLKSAQADIDFFNILKKMGCQVSSNSNQITVKGPKTLKPLGKINLNHMPDGAMTVAILCAFTQRKDGKSAAPTSPQNHLTGLNNLRIKETDRLRALAQELKKIGCQAKETKDGLIINGNPSNIHGAIIETYDDHRLAMCFAVAGSRIPDIKIKNPRCVSKTYPDFWQDLNQIGLKTQ